MINFDLLCWFSEQIIFKLIIINFILVENKGDYFNFEIKIKYDKKVKVDFIILVVYVYYNLKRIFLYMY